MSELIQLAVARERIGQRVRANASITVDLDAACGGILSETLRSDIDCPAFDKALVDGFALQAADWERGLRQWEIVDEIMAGQWPRAALGPGQAARIMTGAPLPPNADAVVMLEQTQPTACGAAVVQVQATQLAKGQNILGRATVMQRGEVVLRRGHRLRPIEMGILAEVGHVQIPIVRPPRVVTIQTGDELIPAGEVPHAGQIRNTNGPLLRGLVRQAGGVPHDLGIVPDDACALRAAIEEGLAADVLVLSGGVSQGDRDLVPGALRESGVESVFHRVQLRPGKPMWYGTSHDGPRVTHVFGLPGNPVSGLVCFQLFVAPTLATLAGHSDAWQWRFEHAELDQAFVARGDRTTCWPGQRSRDDASGIRVHPLDWLGSADPFTLSQADCLIYLSEGNRTYQAGESVPVLPLG